MNNVSNIMLGLIASLLICILVTLAQFTRSPVLITTVTEADEIVQIERLEREVQALKRRIGAQ